MNTSMIDTKDLLKSVENTEGPSLIERASARLKRDIQEMKLHKDKGRLLTDDMDWIAEQLNNEKAMAASMIDMVEQAKKDAEPGKLSNVITAASQVYRAVHGTKAAVTVTGDITVHAMKNLFKPETVIDVTPEQAQDSIRGQ